MIRNFITTVAERICHTKDKLKYLTLAEIVEIIRNGNIMLHDDNYGDYSLKQAIEAIRKMTDDEGNKWKSELLPTVSFNGAFGELDSRHINAYSSVTALDYDHVPEKEMSNLKRTLQANPHVLCVFVTPRGKGLKALILHDNTDPSKHQDMYCQLLDVFDSQYLDTSCKDLARRNYLSYDPNVWTNNNAIPFHYIPTRVQATARVNKNNGSSRRSSKKSVIAIMNKKWHDNNPEYWIEGNRANSIFMLACMMCKWGINLDMATEYFIREWESETMKREEIESHVNNAYKREYLNYDTVEFVIYK